MFRRLLPLLLVVVAIDGARAGFEPGTDRPGNDIRTFELTAPLPAQCEKACNEDQQCQAWTFAWPGKRAKRAHCSLKSEAAQKKPDSCCISGLRSAPVASAGIADEDAAASESAEVPPKPLAKPQREPVDMATVCEEYAREAVQMNQENETLFCRLSGGRWGESYDAYHDWCMNKSTERSRLDNTQARARAIDNCRAEIGWPTQQQSLEAKNARKEQACRAYADIAIRQAGDARDRGCRVDGPRWLQGFQPHFSWCMTVSKTERDSEARERDTALTQCTSQRAATADCRGYARLALQQAVENDERRCGFDGPRWTRNFGAHENWCRSADDWERAEEARIRSQVLAACRSRPRVAQACSRYSNTAGEDARRNVELGCGFAGPRWSGDMERNFLWCMSAKPGQRRRERVTRFRALKECARNAGQVQGTPSAERRYEYRWRKIAGPGAAWTSQWFAANDNRTCEHLTRGCQCGAANYCGRYNDGEVALWWSAGCISRPWEILCEVRQR